MKVTPRSARGNRAMTLVSKKVRDLVDTTAWYHRIELPGGLITPGRIGPSEAMLRALDAIDFRGRTVLDVGCWDVGVRGGTPRGECGACD